MGKNAKNISTLYGLIVVLILILLILAYMYLNTRIFNHFTPSVLNSHPVNASNSSLKVFSTANIIIRNPKTGFYENGTVYLAITPQQQQQGLMNQTGMGDCNGIGSNCIGMLFVFQSSSDQCFWMENTPIKLRQLWFNSNRTAVFVYNATPYARYVECYLGSYVLETQDKRIGAGTTFNITN